MMMMMMMMMMLRMLMMMMMMMMMTMLMLMMMIFAMRSDLTNTPKSLAIHKTLANTKMSKGLMEFSYSTQFGKCLEATFGSLSDGIWSASSYDAHWNGAILKGVSNLLPTT